MTEPNGRYRDGASHSGIHLSNQLASIHALLLIILQKLDKLEGKSKPKGLIPKWLTPTTAIWLGVCALAIGGHITLDQAKLLITGLPK